MALYVGYDAYGDVVGLQEKQTLVSSSVGWMVCREGSVAWMCGGVVLWWPTCPMKRSGDEAGGRVRRP